VTRLRKARFKPTPNGLLDGSTMVIHGDLIPEGPGDLKARYHVSFTSGLLGGCGSVVDADDIELIDDAPEAADA
jgi:hypothetical protein